MTVVTVEDLIRCLERLQARGPIPFDVKSGEVFGILCTCGQGRRTLTAILMTTIFPVPALAERSPLAILGNLGDVRRSMGVVFPEPILDPARTARENLDFHARMHGLGDGGRRRRIAEIARLFNLSGSLDAAVETFPPATVRSLEIARAYLIHPSVLFLAEPTKGLDGAGRRGIWEALQRLNRDRRLTIVLTTENLEEARAICHRVAVVDGGEIVALDTPDTLCAVMGMDDVMPGFDDTA